MTEIINIEQIIELSIETINDEQINEQNELISNNEQIELISNKHLEETIELLSNNETIKFINECGMSIFNFTKDNTNGQIILTPKVKRIKKKYKLYQYNLNIEQFIHIDNFTTFTEISTYLTSLDININLKTLIKNKLLKIELI
jgi:hypothetical protein